MTQVIFVYQHWNAHLMHVCLCVNLSVYVLMGEIGGFLFLGRNSEAWFLWSWEVWSHANIFVRIHALCMCVERVML